MHLTAGHRFDKDVELFLYYDNSHHPSAVVEAGASAAPSGTTLNTVSVQHAQYDSVRCSYCTLHTPPDAAHSR